ncbi:MAG: ATP-binding cassette domain-containing protein [Clostridia bacterium]|nr:ATP-binding cassette domain-containing protein [Clostridia bacterium]
MIKVSNLTKKYGSNLAVDNISFEIEKGRIYGFLGPNGAGKSTTMNIITGCLSQTSGNVTVGGFDVFDQPVKAKKLIGYLPELPPLYGDMTPKEYLRFVAEAKGIKSSAIGPEVERVMFRTSIKQVSGRLIRNLSKGYRQRVGIAMALLGDPEIIILDEPTVGLDPRQIIEIRELIKSLGEDHTVILSSHILSEIQEVCEHVIIISRGKVVADDTIENICNMNKEHPVLNIVASCTPDAAVAIVDEYEEVTHYAITECDKGTSLELTLMPGTNITEKLYFAFAAAGIPLSYFSDRVSIEEIYLKLTESVYDEEEETASVTEEAASDANEEEYKPMFTEEDNSDEGDL